MTKQVLLDFHDLDADVDAFAIVRKVSGGIGLALNRIGEGDFEVVLPLGAARQLAVALATAASDES